MGLGEKNMKRYRKHLWTAFLLGTVFVFACVTVNIYFPAEKVESVAGEIVDEIRGQRSGEKDEPARDDKSSLTGDILLALLPSPAYAQEATTVSNPTIRALKEKLKSQYPRLKPFYVKGMIAEGDDGYVSTRNTQGLGLKEKRDLNSLVSAENSYRKTLYEEVAKAMNIDPSQVNRIAQIFAAEWKKSVR